MILSPSGLTPLTKKNIPSAVQVLTDAFIDYPLPGGFIKNTKRRRVVLNEFFRIVLKKAVKEKNAFHLEAVPHEIAVWLIKNKKTSVFYDIRYVSFSTLKLLFSIRLKELRSLMGCVKRIDALIERQKFSPAAVELLLLAVAPDYQHQGRASTLLRSTFETFDRDQTDCFLTTNKASNTGIYEKLGFKLVYHTVDAPTNLDVFIMFRPANIYNMNIGEPL